jgi:hypothetical protein
MRMIKSRRIGMGRAYSVYRRHEKCIREFNLKTRKEEITQDSYMWMGG